MTPVAYAFKEWSAVVQALGAGEQILILRKGGIAEGRGGFQVKADQFWLFPTAFHAQREKTKSSAAKWFSGPPAAENELRLEYFAQIVRSAFVSDWTTVQALDSYHIWTTDTVKERFDWSKPPGIHALIVRIYQAVTPIILPLTPEMAGCKSWIEVPAGFDARPSSPVLTDAAFAAKRAPLDLLLV